MVGVCWTPAARKQQIGLSSKDHIYSHNPIFWPELLWLPRSDPGKGQRDEQELKMQDRPSQQEGPARSDRN